MFEDMVGVVENWFHKDSVKNKKEFLETPKDKLVMYHSTLGRSIRNEFKLWETHWTPDIRNGVDYSPDHPDQISMRVIEEVWERLNKS
jgi:hypothetical protein